MNKYHKWTIQDGDYIRNEDDISIARPESFKEKIKHWVFSILWKVTIISLLAFLFLKII